MQTRPYDERDGSKIWLSRSEQSRLVEAIEDNNPRRQIAIELGLHGLRSDEVVSVEPQHFEQLDVEAEQYRLVIPDGKTGRRETPVSADLQRRVSMFKGATGLSQNQPVVDRSKRSVRDWIAHAREELADEDEDDRWLELGMHDLRRTWATDGYYSLAFDGVAIAEELIMSYGGWAQTSTGRETFREDYLGPVPDRITAETVDELGLPGSSGAGSTRR